MTKNYKTQTILIKMLSIFIVISILLTTFSTVLASESLVYERISKVKEKIDEVKEEKKPFGDLLSKQLIKEKIGNLKEKVYNAINKLRDKRKNITLKDKDNSFVLKESSKLDLLKILRSYRTLKSSNNTLFSFYTNYAGKEKVTPLKLWAPKSIDVDDDGDSDIRVSYSIYLGFEKNLALSFNIKLNINRLAGFEDEKEYFEAYLQLHFPGLLYENNTNDKVKFGYVSERGYEIPKDFSITYKYIPHILFKEKPKHKIYYNPGLLGNEDILGLVFGYDNADVEDEEVYYKSQSKWITYLDPAARVYITFGGADDYVGKEFSINVSKETKATITYERTVNESKFNAGLVIDKLKGFSFEMEVTPFERGGGRIEYIQNGSDDTNVTLFFKKENATYIYAEGIPSHVKLSWLPESEGYVELTTYDKRIKRIGVRDTPPGLPLFKTHAYLENLPSQLNFSWKLEFEKSGRFNVFCEQEGVSAHLIANDFLGSGTKIEAHFTSKANFDFSVFWNITKKSFGILRTSSDIFANISILGKNGTSFDFSGGINNSVFGPFEIVFDELFNGKANITFTSNTLRIYALDAKLRLSTGSTFILKATELGFNKSQSGLKCSYLVNKIDKDIDLTVDLEIFNGIEIRGLVIGYIDANNNLVYPIPDIVGNGYQKHRFSVRTTQANVRYWISEDKSSGWIEISGGIVVSFNSIFERPPGNLIGSIKGTVAFKTPQDTLNISWNTINNETKLGIDGSGVASLSGFELRIKDKIEISIASIVGSFKINTLGKTGSIDLYVDKARTSFNTDFNINIPKLMNVSLRCSVSTSFNLDLSGRIGFGWSEGNFTYFTGGINAGYQGTIGIYQLGFAYSNLFGVSVDQITLSGDIRASFNLSYLGLDVSSASGITFSAQGIRVNGLANLGVPISEFSCGLIEIYGKGAIELDLTRKPLLMKFTGDAGLKVATLEVESKQMMLLLNLDLLQINIGGRAVIDLNRSIVIFDGGASSLLIISTLAAVYNNIGILLSLKMSASAEMYIQYSTDSIILNLAQSSQLAIDNFRLDLNLPSGASIKARWRRFAISLGPGGTDATVTLGTFGLNAYVNIKTIELLECSLDFVNKSEETKLAINGEFTATFGTGASGLALMVDTREPYLGVSLNSGELSINNFKLSVEWAKGNNNGAVISLYFSRVSLQSTLSFAVKGSKSGFIFVNVKGKGAITASKFAFAAVGDFIVEPLPANRTIGKGILAKLDSLDLDLDNIRGSVIDLNISKIGEKWLIGGLQSAEASATISKIIIKDLQIGVGYLAKEWFDPEGGFWYPAPPDDYGFEVNITDLNMNFEGKGSIYVKIAPSNNDALQNIRMEGKIDGPGKLFIDYLFINALWSIVIELDDFTLVGPTTYHLEGKGRLRFGNNPYHDLELTAGAASKWSSKVLNIYYLAGFDNFEGQGDIYVGLRVAPDATGGGDFIISASGEYKWSNLRIQPYYLLNETGGRVKYRGLSLGSGNYKGNAEVRLDLATFMVLFGNPLPDENRIQFSSSSETTISQEIRITASDALQFLEFQLAGGTPSPFLARLINFLKKLNNRDFMCLVMSNCYFSPGVVTVYRKSEVEYIENEPQNLERYDTSFLFTITSTSSRFSASLFNLLLSIDLISLPEEPQVTVQLNTELVDFTMFQGSLSFNGSFSEETISSYVNIKRKAKMVTTSEISLSLIRLACLPLFNIEVWFVEGTIQPGQFSLSLERYGREQDSKFLGHGYALIEGSGTILSHLLRRIVIEDLRTGKTIFYLDDVIMASVPYLEISWDIDALAGTPDYKGYIAIDTKGETVEIDLSLFEMIRLLHLKFKANKWNVSWNVTGHNIFRWIEISGSIDREKGDVFINVNGTWYSLWGSLLGTMRVSITDYSGSGTPTNMKEGDKFKVKVEDVSTNKPISGARAHYQYQGPLGVWWNYGEPLETGSDGKTGYFIAKKIGDATNYRIKVTALGYRDGYVEFTIGTSSYGVLSGTVKSLYYGPISGATVSAAGVSATTDSQGMYSLTLPAGTHLVTASKQGYKSETQEATIVGGQQSTLNFYLSFENAAYFRGYVYDGSQQNAVLINATVAASGPPGTFIVKSRPITPLGWYEMEVIGGYSYTLTVSYPGYQTQTIANQFINPEESKRIDITLYPQGQSGIGGKVIDNYGYPLSSVTVKIGSITLTTGSNGNYYTQVTPGTYTITVSKNKFMTQTATVTVSSGQSVTKDFQLIPEYGPYGYIVGKVKDKNTGVGIAGVKVSTTGATGYTDSSGNYRLYVKSGDNNIDGGHYGYYITANGSSAGYGSGYVYLSWVIGDRDNSAQDIYLDRTGTSWVLPTGYSDPSNDWRGETYAYDDNVNTWAVSKARYGSTTEWTGFLELTISSIKCDAIKFNAFYESQYVNKIDVDVYYNGAWHDVYEGSYSNHAWVTKYLGGTYQVTKARVRFYLKGCFTGTTAQLYEFAFRKVP